MGEAKRAAEAALRRYMCVDQVREVLSLAVEAGEPPQWLADAIDSPGRRVARWPSWVPGTGWAEGILYRKTPVNSTGAPA